MKITERRIVVQDWYETDRTKTGWDSNGWCFKDDENVMDETEWTVIEHIKFEKSNNCIMGIAEKETEI